MTAIVDTTRSSLDSPRPYPPMRARRLLARAIDLLIGFGLASLIVLPFTFSQATDALLLGGFGSFPDFLTDWDPGTAARGSVRATVEQLQPVVLATVYLQGLIVWAYDWLAHTLTGSSVGKAIARVRVTRHRSSEPTIAPGLQPRQSWVRRAARMGLRSALVVGPPTLAVAMLLAAAFAVPGAADVAEVFIALTVVLFIVWLAGGVGLHGLATGTRVVGFEWQRLMQEAEQHIEYHTGHADAYLHKLQQAARGPSAQRAVRSAEQDPRVRSAMAQGQAVAQQAEQTVANSRDSMPATVPSREGTVSAARQLGEAFRKGGLRGIVESFTRPPPSAGGP
ncbi:RDD family protein [Ornithinimicrobium cryptoxanthini]|uniref:RDD family protein n=1 Tax=Ornithinimicrobium cryptoxanthini TaxID=2934161 RepID=A0ABY4YMH0_9MICO|nr:RDD family protein [Ornithinimicrobium cryptoxanthini]USQ77736.1 RDD family protein [Ornithinimicrobium cryptoxanthini]